MHTTREEKYSSTISYMSSVTYSNKLPDNRRQLMQNLHKHHVNNQLIYDWI